MIVRELWRYPVKSMGGERVLALPLERRGAIGDRLWAVRDEAGLFGSGKTWSRFRRIDGLLFFSAKLEGDVPVVTFPSGEVIRGDDPAVHASLTAALGVNVTLAHDADKRFHDEGAVHLVSTSALRSVLPSPLDVRRVRPNLVIDTGDAPGFPEDAWGELSIGEVRLRVVKRTGRCVMTTMPQPELPEDPAVLRELAKERAGRFGVYAEVLEPGVIREGDRVRV